jgi:drug/metabolite transporter superfamily protein YnfA
MPLGTGIAIASMWLAVTAITCTAMIRSGTEWVPYAAFGGLFVAWFLTDNMLEVGRPDDCDEKDGDDKDSRGVDPAR